MPQLKDELASLRIDRDTPRRGRWRIPVLLLVIAVVAAALYFFRARLAIPALGAVEVDTVQARVENSGGPNAGTPILTASGYLVARKQSVVSSRIQGRIDKLLVEEGSVVKEGDVLATLDNADISPPSSKPRLTLSMTRLTWLRPSDRNGYRKACTVTKWSLRMPTTLPRPR